MKGILFKPDMIKAVREERKTQTRRVINPQPIIAVNELKEHDKVTNYWIPYTNDWRMVNNNAGYRKDDCGYIPRYQVGEVVYIKEATCIECFKQYKIKHACLKSSFEETPLYCDYVKWRSPMFMYAWSARDFIRITDVRAEKLWDISEEDAKAEGSKCNWIIGDPQFEQAKLITAPHSFEPQQIGSTYRLGFQILWDSINCKKIRSKEYTETYNNARGGLPTRHYTYEDNPFCWGQNPWVWVYSFELLEGKP